MKLNNEEPLISVIMPVYNEEQYIEASLNSILNQTEKNYELIVLDDHSTDATVRIISRYADMDTRIIVIKNNEQIGIVANLNHGI